MNYIQRMWYRKQLAKLPSEVPYERLAAYMWRRTELQIQAHNITIWKLLPHPVYRIKRWWKHVTFKHYEYYIHDAPGLYISGAQCKQPCQHCIKYSSQTGLPV